MFCVQRARGARHENSISTSVELGIRGHWERFPIKVFEGKHSFSLEFCVNND